VLQQIGMCRLQLNAVTVTVTMYGHAWHSQFVFKAFMHCRQACDRPQTPKETCESSCDNHLTQLNRHTLRHCLLATSNTTLLTNCHTLMTKTWADICATADKPSVCTYLLPPRGTFDNKTRVSKRPVRNQRPPSTTPEVCQRRPAPTKVAPPQH
jgi:hypothetical protein